MMLKKFNKINKRGASQLSAQSQLPHRFSKDEKGVAAIEFAFLAPLLLALTLGSIEITQSVWADGKVEQATSTIGDLVSRTPIMTDDELMNLGEAGPLVLRPNPQNDLNFTVTSIIGCYDDPDPEATNRTLNFYVLWSKVWEGGQLSNSTYQVDDEFDKQPEGLQINDGETLIVTEGLYNYAPTIARKVGTSYEMGGFAFHQPRSTSTRVSYPEAESPQPRSCVDFRPTT